MKTLILTTIMIAMSGVIWGEPVYFSKAGKTAHADRACTRLKRTTELFQADKAVAEKEGLKIHDCGKAKAGGRAWATKVQ